MSKLRAVIRHEYLTIVKQPSFWIVMVAIPLVIGMVGFFVYLGNSSSEDHLKEVASSLKDVAIVDESSLINKDVVASAALTLSAPRDVDTLRERVRTGAKEALVVYPTTLAKDRHYTIYLSSNDLTKMSSVTSLADSLLKTSLFLPLGSPDIIALAQTGASTDVTVFKDGTVSNGINEYIAPGLFVVLFYLIFAFSISYMLASVSEEKENRSMEMVLTYVKPRTLIVGKLLAVSFVTLTQIAFFGLLGLIAVLLFNQFGSGVSLPLGLDLAKMTIDPLVIFLSAAYLIVGFLMYAGFMIATAAAAPSAKEANNFASVFFIGAFVPFYFVMMLATDPENPLVEFLTFFPLTSPVVTLIRNTVGNLGALEAWLALGTMTICMMISIWIAVRAFRLGALEFSQTIKLSTLFKR